MFWIDDRCEWCLFAIPPIEIGGFKMIDVVRAKILSETYVLKFPKRSVPFAFSIKIAPKGKPQFLFSATKGIT